MSESLDAEPMRAQVELLERLLEEEHQAMAQRVSVR